MSFFSNPLKSSFNIFKKTLPPLPVINPSTGSPGLYVPGKNNSYYAYGSGNKSAAKFRNTVHPINARSTPPRGAHISPIAFHGGRISEF